MKKLFLIAVFLVGLLCRNGYALESDCLPVSSPPTYTAGVLAPCITDLNGNQFVRLGSPTLWFAGTTASAATTTQLKAAPGANLSLYVTQIITQSNTSTAGLFTVISGTGSNCLATPAALLNGSVNSLYASPANTAPPNIIPFFTPLKLPANTALCVQGVATNTTNITVLGFTAP